MNLVSQARALNPVVFPDFTRTKVYMEKAPAGCLHQVLPRQYWDMSAQMVKDANLDPNMPVFVTIDEREVLIGTQHRRGGLHIDGHFLFSWKNGGWLNGVPGRVLTPEQHKAQYQCNKGGMLIASNYYGCDAFLGVVQGIPGQGGDCEHLRHTLDSMEKISMEPNRAYLTNSMCVHQSMPLDATVKRQLIRITLDHNFQFQ
jgi:hypothetical protein